MTQVPDIEAVRAQIPATSKYVYLSGWQGPSPLSVIGAVENAFRIEAEAPTAPPVHEQRLAEFRRSRQKLASLIGAGADEVAIQQNTTEGINAVLSGLALKPGDEVITASGEHSSMIVPAYYARDRLGMVLKIARLAATDSPADILARFEELATPALRLILVSHISYSTGQVLPIRELAALAHSYGGFLLLDAAQSVGQLPVDVHDLECDFCAFPGHKWLLGPAATGALYVRGDLISMLQPVKVSHHASHFFNFKDRFEPKGDTIDKFEMTTVSVPLLAGLNAAIDYIQGIGLEAIARRSVDLASYATGCLSGIDGAEIISQPDHSRVASGIVSFAIPGVPPATLTAHLWETARVIGRTIPDAGATRLCFHLFNTQAEIDAVTEVIRSAVKRGVPDRDRPSIQVEWDAMVEL